MQCMCYRYTYIHVGHKLMICTSYISIACSTQVDNETSVASTLTDSERGEGGGEEEGGGGGGGGSDEHELAEKPNEDTEKKEE